MVAKSIDWGLDNNKGVSFYTINKGLNKLLMEEGSLMITLGKMMNTLNSVLSDASNRLQDVTKNLNWINAIDTRTSTLGMIMLIGTIASGGLMGLSSMAMEPELTEEASSLTKAATTLNKGAEGMGSAKMKLLLGSLMGAGVVMNLLQAYCSLMKGIDNSKILKTKAYSDGSQQGINMEARSEGKAANTMQAIGKAVQKAMQEEYRSKTRDLYYNN